MYPRADLMYLCTWKLKLTPDVAECACRFPKDTQPGLVRAAVGSKKLIALGLQVTPMEKIIRDAVESLESRGLIIS